MRPDYRLLLLVLLGLLATTPGSSPPRLQVVPTRLPLALRLRSECDRCATTHRYFE